MHNICGLIVSNNPKRKMLFKDAFIWMQMGFWSLGIHAMYVGYNVKVMNL